jgi:aspartyl-tRNA(Asn)/glutamyl-tRNA(Gln) amidotransferase subunit A
MESTHHQSLPATAVQLAAAYADGRVTPADAAETCLRRASASQAVFTCITADRAREEAEQSTARWRAGRPLSPLDGVPISWKDLLDVRGTPTTAASALLRSTPPARSDATVVARAAAAGMVCLGKTNLSEFAYSGLGLNPGFGTPVNPRLGARARAPGGSSSGAALAVVQGCGPLAMGTDTAGSVRIPAAFNGLVGYRASSGRYPMQGVFALAPSLDTLGPLALSVADCMALDRVLRGLADDGNSNANASLATDLRNQVFCTDLRLLDDDRVHASVRVSIYWNS